MLKWEDGEGRTCGGGSSARVGAGTWSADLRRSSYELEPEPVPCRSILSRRRSRSIGEADETDTGERSWSSWPADDSPYALDDAESCSCAKRACGLRRDATDDWVERA